MQIVTLTTDFGTADWFVGTMKGVILGIAPRATIVDITHELPGRDIRAGAFALVASYGLFPRKTAHVAVVDPGVGSRRAAIAVQTTNYFFVGPDNGVLSLALSKEKIKHIHRLTNEKLFLQPVSRTFHGRDIFAPVAAHLSRGVPIHKFGPALKDFVRLDWPQPRTTPTGIQGEIVYIDRFGNTITNINSPSLVERKQTRIEVFVKRKRLCQVKEFYQVVPVGMPVGVVGSSGFLEIAVNGGSAARKLGLRIGDTVTVRPN